MTVSGESTAPALRNPFPGIRPFRSDEDFLFFGRESQINTMVDKLAATHFLTVVGTSGCGKSSLVNCGLRPALHRGLMASAGTSWRIAQLRPGSNPLKALSGALAANGVLFTDFQPEGISVVELVEATLSMSKLGIVDLYEQAELNMPSGDRPNLLVVVDQFEELFRFRDAGTTAQEAAAARSQEAIAFVNLLLEASAQREFPIFVVLTMRSDFLGDCSQLAGLPEAINAGQYLVPRLTRDELRSAITGPVHVGGGEIAPTLLTRLVNDVGDMPDQLSLLQHALNRTWFAWEHDPAKAEALELRHYESIGTMARAIDQHAERAFAELPEGRPRAICEDMFKALTDIGTDARGIRRPTSMATLCALTSANPEGLTQVIDVFRKPSRSFLMPPAGDALDSETIVDISHESLMRVWVRLREWVDDEARGAAQFRRLAQSAEMHANRAAGLMEDPELANTLAWRDKHRPAAAWAQRYSLGYDVAMSFLDESRNTRDTYVRAKATQRKRATWTRNAIVGVVGFSVLAAIYEFSQAAEVRKDNLLKAAQVEQATKFAESVRLQADAEAAAAKARWLSDKQRSIDSVLREGPPKQTDSLAKLRKEYATNSKQLDSVKKAAGTKAVVAARATADAAASYGGGLSIGTESIRRDDLFDVSRGTRVSGSSGLSSAGNGRGMFGGSVKVPTFLGMLGDGQGDAEDVVTFFADGKPMGFTHWIEWETSGAVDLRSVGLFARHDVAIDGFLYRRAFSRFRLYARPEKEWVPIAEYRPALPYGSGTGLNLLAVCLAVEPVTARAFRAEFTQAVDIIGQYSSPRVVALDGYARAGCADGRASAK